MVEAMQVELENVKYEEEWEGLVMDVAEEEGKVKATEEEIWGSWRDAVTGSEWETKRKLTRLMGGSERVAVRMMGIVEKERGLAEKERRQRRHRRKEEKWKLKKERWDAEGVTWDLSE